MMTPKELVHRAIDKARTDIQYDLEQLELWYDHPQTNVDDVFIGSFENYCLNHLVSLLTHYCKARKSPDSSTDYTDCDGYQIGRIPNGYVICIERKYSSIIPYLPENIEEVLDEYCNMRKSFRHILEQEYIDFKSGIMAGRIIGTSINSLAGDILDKYSMQIKVLCQKDGAWKCTLTSTLFEVSITFFSDAEHIREDIERSSMKLYRLDR